MAGMADETLSTGPLAGDEEIPEDRLTDARSTSNRWAVLVWVLVALVLAGLAYWLGARQSRQASIPAANSAEVGFARDMMTHHAQAVEMAILLRERTEDESLSQIALDILLTQQAQIGHMQAWLTLWGHPLASTEPAMAWMGMPVNGLMPGMATAGQLNELRSLHGVEADILFLQLMITHHQAGVSMAEATLEMAQEPAVRALAQSMVDAQSLEIELMESLLEQKGAAPAPVEEMDHGDPSH